MLHSLRIQNIAIVESLEVELKPGLNILTGETGAGKSIILKSIELLCGKRANSNLIRSGSEKAIVEALFTLDEDMISFLFQEFPELDDLLDRNENDLVIKRVLEQSGRSKYYINGSIFSQNIISRVTAHLVEITGQNDQIHLRDSSYHRQILDNFGLDKKYLEETKEAFENFKKKNDFLNKLNNSREELLYKFERLSFTKNELQKLNLKKGEKAELVEEIERVKHLDKIKSGSEEIIDLLEGKSVSRNANYSMEELPSQGSSIYDVLSKSCSILERILTFDKSFENILETAQQGLSCINELNSQIQDVLSKLNFDPEKFDLIQSRLGQINLYERKYNKNSEELCDYLIEIESELSQFEGTLFDEKKLEKEIAELREILANKEQILTENRKKIAKKFSKEVSKNLSDLSMPKARFEVDIQPKESSANGADEIIFKFSANPGEPIQPLDKVASGGELSRLQLIIKSISQSSKLKFLNIFDEIDTGVSGATSHVVGEKLLSLSKKSQIIVITHSAQIAALADNHIFVEKEIKNDRTFSKISYLDDTARKNVIAGMLAGKNVTKEFLDSADALLESRKLKN